MFICYLGKHWRALQCHCQADTMAPPSNSSVGCWIFGTPPGWDIAVLPIVAELLRIDWNLSASLGIDRTRVRDSSLRRDLDRGCGSMGVPDITCIEVVVYTCLRPHQHLCMDSQGFAVSVNLAVTGLGTTSMGHRSARQWTPQQIAHWWIHYKCLLIDSADLSSAFLLSSSSSPHWKELSANVVSLQSSMEKSSNETLSEFSDWSKTKEKCSFV